jgi:lipocalin
VPVPTIVARILSMSDIFTVLQSAYATAPLTPTNVKYTPVDAKSYQGTWSGTYSNNQKFDLTISNVNGFRAQVKYQSGSTVQFGQVLIGNSSFRIGNTKFLLTGNGQATVANAVTDPVTGNTSLVKGTATLS